MYLRPDCAMPRLVARKNSPHISASDKDQTRAGKTRNDLSAGTQTGNAAAVKRNGAVKKPSSPRFLFKIPLYINGGIRKDPEQICPVINFVAITAITLNKCVSASAAHGVYRNAWE